MRLSIDPSLVSVGLLVGNQEILGGDLRKRVRGSSRVFVVIVTQLVTQPGMGGFAHQGS
jgi:hypothetical protein